MTSSRGLKLEFVSRKFATEAVIPSSIRGCVIRGISARDVDRLPDTGRCVLLRVNQGANEGRAQDTTLGPDVVHTERGLRLFLMTCSRCLTAGLKVGKMMLTLVRQDRPDPNFLSLAQTSGANQPYKPSRSWSKGGRSASYTECGGGVLWVLPPEILAIVRLNGIAFYC